MRIIPLAALALATLANAQEVSFEERELFTIPDDVALESAPTMGPDGKQYTDRSRIVWSPDGKRAAYAGYRNGQSVAVIGDEVGDETFHYMSPPTFSADGAHVVFRVGNRKTPKKEEWWPLLDGEKGTKFDWIGEISIGPDGTLAFWEQPGAKIVADGSYNRGKQVLHFGKKTSKKWEDASSLIAPAVSDDGKLVASAAMKGGRWYVITMDPRGKTKTEPKRGHGMITACAVSANGKRIACVAGDGIGAMPPGMPAGMVPGAKMAIHVGGDQLGDDADEVGSPVFAPKGKRLAYVFAKGKKMGVALDDDGKLMANYDFVGTPVFSSDGKRIAYPAYTGSKIDAYIRMFDWASDRVSGGKAQLVMRAVGKRPAPLDVQFDAITMIRWSPDGRSVAFAAKTGDSWQIVCGPHRSAEFDEVGPPRFDPRSKRIAFGARSGKEVFWKVLDTNREASK